MHIARGCLASEIDEITFFHHLFVSRNSCDSTIGIKKKPTIKLHKLRCLEKQYQGQYQNSVKKLVSGIPNAMPLIWSRTGSSSLEQVNQN